VALVDLCARRPVFAIMGMFLRIGVVKKNAILPVDYTNVLRGRGLSRFEAQIEADRARLRPILMTTLAIVFGMLRWPSDAAADRRSASS